MTTKTKTTKTTKTKTAAAQNAETLRSTQAQTFMIDRAATMADRVQLLQSADEVDVAAVRTAKNAHDRAAMFAALLQDDKFAQAWDTFELEGAKVANMQIYAQDKLAATLRAVAANCALSNVRAGNHSNSMTQRLVHVLKQHKAITVANAPRFMHDAFDDKSMGTYSAQATSSRQVLDVLGMLSWDVLTKTFSLNERAAEYDHVIAN